MPILTSEWRVSRRTQTFNAHTNLRVASFMKDQGFFSFFFFYLRVVSFTKDSGFQCPDLPPSSEFHEGLRLLVPILTSEWQVSQRTKASFFLLSFLPPCGRFHEELILSMPRLTTLNGTRFPGVVQLSLQSRARTGYATVVGSGVVAATSSFAHARPARDGHLTPAFP